MATTTVTAGQLRSTVSMPEAVDAVRRAFLDLDAGEFDQPARIAMADGRFLTMAVHHRPTSSAIVKMLSLNFDRDPAIVGTVVWTDTSGTDQLVADAGSLTSLRTGALVGVATDLLASPDAERMVLIGAGGQAADQIRGVLAVRRISTLTVVDHNPGKAARLLDSMAGELQNVGAKPAESAAGSLAEADIVCCATPATTPLFDLAAVPARVHVNAIGAFRPSMRELPSDLLAEAAVFVDDKAAVLQESGEILHALSTGAITHDDLTEIGSALRHGAAPPSGRTVFKTVGVAAQDWAIAHLLATKSRPSTTPSS